MMTIIYTGLFIFIYNISTANCFKLQITGEVKPTFALNHPVLTTLLSVYSHLCFTAVVINKTVMFLFHCQE